MTEELVSSSTAEVGVAESRKRPHPKSGTIVAAIVRWLNPSILAIIAASLC